MAESSWPDTTAAVTERGYEDLLHPLSPDALIGLPSDVSPIYATGASGLKVHIESARYAHVRGNAWYSGSVDVDLTVTANSSGSTRIDLVVLRYDRTTRTVRGAVVAGTPGTGLPPNPTRDTGTDAGVWELPVATVSVPNGATNIAPGAVTDISWYLGDDGSTILAKDSTHFPPHGMGNRVYNADNGRVYVSTGVAWVTDLEDTGLTNLTLEAGWAIDAFSRAWYERKNGIVTVCIGAKRTGSTVPISGGTAGGFTLAVLPSGFRPRERIYIVGVINNGSAVLGNGQLHPYPNIIGSISTSGVIAFSEFPSVIPTNKWIYAGSYSFTAATA